MEHYEIRGKITAALRHLMAAESIANATATPKLQQAVSKLVNDTFEILNSLRG